MTESTERVYDVRAASTSTFGRVLLSARDQHLVVDGPAANGCPGEAITPAEMFLGGVATCGVELLQVIARAREVPLSGVGVTVNGVMDVAKRSGDVTVFDRVAVHFVLGGVGHDDAAALVEAFKGR